MSSYEPNHKVVAFLFVIAMMPFWLAGMVVGLVWRSAQAGIEAVDRFIEWM